MAVNNDIVRRLVRDYPLEVPALPGSRLVVHPITLHEVQVDASSNNLGGDETGDVLGLGAAHFVRYRGNDYTGRITLRRDAEGTWQPIGGNNRLYKRRSVKWEGAPASYALVIMSRLIEAAAAWAETNGDALAAAEYQRADFDYARAVQLLNEAQRSAAEAEAMRDAAAAARRKAGYRLTFVR